MCESHDPRVQQRCRGCPFRRGRLRECPYLELCDQLLVRPQMSLACQPSFPRTWAFCTMAFFTKATYMPCRVPFIAERLGGRERDALATARGGGAGMVHEVTLFERAPSIAR